MLAVFRGNVSPVMIVHSATTGIPYSGSFLIVLIIGLGCGLLTTRLATGFRRMPFQEIRPRQNPLA